MAHEFDPPFTTLGQFLQSAPALAAAWRAWRAGEAVNIADASHACWVAAGYALSQLPHQHQETALHALAAQQPQPAFDLAAALDDCCFTDNEGDAIKAPSNWLAIVLAIAEFMLGILRRKQE